MNSKEYNTSISVSDFDPKSPASLIIARSVSASSAGTITDADADADADAVSSQFTSLLSDDGAGCNAEEIQCLMRLIDAHSDAHIGAHVDAPQNNTSSSTAIVAVSASTTTNNATGTGTVTGTVKAMNSKRLSKAYRTHIVECIQRWEERLEVSETTDASTTLLLQQQQPTESKSESYEKQMDQEYKNKELLKLTHAITHLAEIYLCPTYNNSTIGRNPNKRRFQDEESDEFQQLSTSANTTAVSTYYNTSMPKREQTQAGIVTADTVRYLRYHHIEDINQYMKDAYGVMIEEVFESNQPEHWLPQEDDDNDNNQIAMALTPFWELVRKLVKRGLLKDAWSVLRRHSACVRAVEKFSNPDENRRNSTTNSSSFIDQTLREDIEAFALIEKLLLFAPIPGGRTEVRDSGLISVNDTDNEDENDIDEEEEEETEDDWWNGIAVNSYKLWDSHSNDDLESSSNLTRNNISETPSEFNIYAVMNIYNSWKMSISSLLKSNSALRNLTRRIPSLQTCIWDVILHTQDSFTNNSEYDDNDWAERLVAELLYVRPNIRKDSIAIRARVHMKDCGLLTDDHYNSMQQMEDIVLEVMRGNAGTAIEALHSFGGASGAALPATMTALLCSLLVDNGQIQLSDLSYDIRTEKLLSASAAILSSFTIQNHNDIGIRLSTKLLQPHITPENMQVTAHVAAMLNRHWPKTDAEVRGLLAICMDAIERGSFRMLDACESLCFSRSIFYFRRGTLESSTYWLLRGIECATKLDAIKREEGVIRTDVTRSMCYRRLTKLCVDMSTDLLKSLSKDSVASDDYIPLKQVKTIQIGIDEDELADLIRVDPSVSLFRYVTNIGWNSLEKNYKEVANSIVHCLEERKDMDGSLIILAYPGLYGLLLSLAFDILSSENELFGEITDTSFDVYGMQVLLCTFDCYCKKKKYGIHYSCYSIRDDITLESMRVALGKGLMRAFIAENAKIGKEKSNVKNNLGTRSKRNADSSVNLDQLLGPSM